MEAEWGGAGCAPRLSNSFVALWSNVVLDDALLLAVSRFMDKVGFVDFPVECVSLHVGDVVH